jgi:predicted enzyme related to lactoylglutathione lyase
MAGQIAIGGVHHLRLTVTDLARSRDFYMHCWGLTLRWSRRRRMIRPRRPCIQFSGAASS